VEQLINRQLENGAPQPVRVWLVEPDPFARWGMAHWLNTHSYISILAATAGPGHIQKRLFQFSPQIILLNMDDPMSAEWLDSFARSISSCAPEARVVCTAVGADRRLVDWLSQPVCSGYLLKGEMREALAEAVLAAAAGHRVLTPAAERTADALGMRLSQAWVLAFSSGSSSVSPIL